MTEYVYDPFEEIMTTPAAPKRVVLVRHGESTWNKMNLFTGWTDVPLSDKGMEEACNAGGMIKASGIPIDCVFTSVLTRAKQTFDFISLIDNDLLDKPLVSSWRLNESHCGALEGQNK